MKKNLITRGFSRVDLLIAIALLAILGSIAVSETITTRTRADVARVRMDMRRVALALEAYKVDQGDYPHLKIYADNPAIYNILHQYDRGGLWAVTNLTTPVAYLTSNMISDPFTVYDVYGGPQPSLSDLQSGKAALTMYYLNVDLFYKSRQPPVTPGGRPGFYLISQGPDRIGGPNPISYSRWSVYDYIAMKDSTGGYQFDAWQYDPSNGTISRGDILQYPWR